MNQLRTKNVMGPHRANRGSASQPVTATHGHAKTRSLPALTGILVPLDFSLGSRSVLAYAANVVEPPEASITLLHVVQPLIIEADYGYGPVTRKVPNAGVIKKART